MKLLLGTLLLAAGICQAGDIALTIKAHDAPALVLTVPAKAKVTTSATKTEIHTDDMILCVWSIDQAKTVDEGLARIPQVIEHEVLEFAAASTNEIGRAHV